MVSTTVPQYWPLIVHSMTSHVRRNGQATMNLFTKDTDLIHDSRVLMTPSLPKCSPVNALTLEIGVKHLNVGGNTNIQTLPFWNLILCFCCASSQITMLLSQMTTLSNNMPYFHFPTFPMNCKIIDGSNILNFLILQEKCIIFHYYIWWFI